jgi:hypothetical protein
MKKQLLLGLVFLVHGFTTVAQVSSPNGTFNAGGTSNLQLQTNLAPQLTIMGSGANYGFIGIGNASPAHKLDVSGTVNASSYLLSGNPLIGSQWTTSGTTINYTSGFVGINNPSPSHRLDVNGTVNATSFLVNGSEHRSSQWTTASSNIYFNTGSVAIGALAPEARLHIKDGNILLDNGATPFLFTGTGTTELNRYLQLANSPGLQNASGLKAGGLLVADNFSYANPAKNDLIVKGKVGIGTTLLTNPNNYTLAVNGKIGAKDVQVETSSTTWPDYVFAQDYRLPSLHQVEEFIKENNHLESVPSAKEIEKNGHSLGEMDIILLKKVEELTLYIIQQQKEIEELKKKIEQKEK